MISIFKDVMCSLEKNVHITKFLWLIFFATSELTDFPEIKEQLIGDWDEAEWGQKITITFSDPYQVERGYIFTLPALEGTFIDRALVHIPGSVSDRNEAFFYTLKHLAAVATTIELEPSL